MNTVLVCTYLLLASLVYLQYSRGMLFKPAVIRVIPHLTKQKDCTVIDFLLKKNDKAIDKFRVLITPNDLISESKFHENIVGGIPTYSFVIGLFGNDKIERLEVMNLIKAVYDYQETATLSERRQRALAITLVTFGGELSDEQYRKYSNIDLDKHELECSFQHSQELIPNYL